MEKQLVHPDELHRLRNDERGGAYLDPHERLQLLDPATGKREQSSFHRALSVVASFSRRPDDRVTLLSPHGYSITRSRRQWGDILRSIAPQTGFAEWLDELPEGGREPGELPEGNPGTFVDDRNVWGTGGSNQGSLFFARDKDEGRWITIGSRAGEDGKRHGGSPVFIQGGRIVKGHPKLTGRKIAALHEEPETGTHRQQLTASRDHERATWRKKAKAEGVHPNDLDHLAAEIKAHADAFTEDRRRMLHDARRAAKSLDHGDLRTIALHRGRGHLDADAVKGLDDVAARMAEKHPEQFHGHEPTERLFELLNAGDPQPMAESDAYREALDHLAGESAKWRNKLGEAIPFAREQHPRRLAAAPLMRLRK